MSLAVATPSRYNSFCGECDSSVMDLQRQCMSRGIGFKFLANFGIGAIDVARNIWQRFLLETDATHMLFINGDMGFSATELMRMFDWKDADVIAVMCPKNVLAGSV